MKNNYCDISVVLDRSGSMDSIKDDVIGGYNAFLKGQQEMPGECTISLYQFDDIYEAVYEGKDVKSAPLLTRNTYMPRNSTALLDAIGKTINKTGDRLSKINEKNRPSKVLFVIQTDGMENASQEFDRNKISEMIKHQKEKYNWEFVYLGANQDAIATAASFGIGRNATLNFASTSFGAAASYLAVSGATCAYRSASNSSAFSFSDEDRKINDNLINQTNVSTTIK